jgi:hypothetical protein
MRRAADHPQADRDGAHECATRTGGNRHASRAVHGALGRDKAPADDFVLGYEAADFPFVLRMLSQGRIGVDGLVTATVGLDEAPVMFAKLMKPNDHCKVLITP